MATEGPQQFQSSAKNQKVNKRSKCSRLGQAVKNELLVIDAAELVTGRMRFMSPNQQCQSTES